MNATTSKMPISMVLSMLLSMAAGCLLEKHHMFLCRSLNKRLRVLLLKPKTAATYPTSPFAVIDVSVASGPSFANAKSAFLVQYYVAFLCNSKSFNLDKPACYQTQSVVSPYRTLSGPYPFYCYTIA